MQGSVYHISGSGTKGTLIEDTLLKDTHTADTGLKGNAIANTSLKCDSDSDAGSQPINYILFILTCHRPYLLIMPQ